MFRILLIATAAVGATWAAELAVLHAARTPQPTLAQPLPAAEAGAATAPAASAESTSTAPAPAADAGMSPEEVEEELARIEAEVAGADQAELEEFTPTKPLAADLAIALPSDI